MSRDHGSVVLVDTGPLVALLNARERHHAWTRERFATLRPPLFTCEPVLAEASHLVQHLPGGREAVLELVRRGVLRIDLRIEAEIESILALVRRYRDLPMSLADACLVRLAELQHPCRVLTFDSEFDIYRRDGRHTLDTLHPPRP